MAAADQKPTPRRAARLWAYFRRYLSWYGAGGFFLVITNLAALQIPELIGDSVQLMRESDEGSFLAVSEEVTGSAIWIIWLALVAGVARVLSRITIFNAGRFIEFDLRNELYAKLTTLGPRFFGSMPTGDLTSRAANDVTFVRGLFALPFLHVINASLAYGIALRKMVALDLWLTVICLLPYPILLFAVRGVIRAMFQQTKIVQEHLAKISARVQENLTGMHVVKTYVLEEREKQRFGVVNDGFVGKNMRLALYRGGLTALMSMMAGSGTLLVLLIGAQRVVEGSLDLGQFVEFNGYVVALAFPTVAIGWVFSIWHRGLAAFDRITEVLDAESEIVTGSEPPHAADRGIGAEIVFDEVSFAYPDGSAAVENVSLTIRAGSTVAFVGRTGSGKTTLIKLLSRFYDPTSGEIRLDGVALPDLELREMRSEFGVVSQGPFLFSMSLGNNLRFGLDALQHDDTVHRGAPTKSLERDEPAEDQDQRIAESLRIAGLDSDIDGFPEGLATLVGERGITLSGGQKQRVTIARALLVDPRILVLDDALSSVDTKTEAAILDHLESVMAGRTSILVTHRFNALPRVDRIFVMDHGRIIEEGTHDELVERGGAYAAMWARQQLAEALDE